MGKTALNEYRGKNDVKVMRKIGRNATFISEATKLNGLGLGRKASEARIHGLSRCS